MNIMYFIGLCIALSAISLIAASIYKVIKKYREQQ